MTSHHLRNTAPMLSSPRCCAFTRNDEPCRSPAVAGTRLCRMHGNKEPVGTKSYRRSLRRCLDGLMSLEQDHEARQLIDRVRAEMAALGDNPES